MDESSWVAREADGRLQPLAHHSQTITDTSGWSGSWGHSSCVMDRKELGRASKSTPLAVAAIEGLVGEVAFWLQFSPLVRAGGDRNGAIEMRVLSPALQLTLLMLTPGAPGKREQRWVFLQLLLPSPTAGVGDFIICFQGSKFPW